MDFDNEVKRLTKSTDRYSVEFGATHGYVRGVKKLLSFGPDKLEFLVEKDKSISVNGKKLSITGFFSGDVSFSGAIESAEIRPL